MERIFVENYNFNVNLPFFNRTAKKVVMFVLFAIFRTSNFRSKKTDYVI